MLTGYGNLPTAVAAVKAGAIDYMAKPVDADDVEAALLASPESKAKPPENPMSADRVKWEHIHRVLNYVIEMFLKQLGDLKCIEELFKEFYLRDLQDKVSLLNKVIATENIKIFKISAGKKGRTPKANN